MDASNTPSKSDNPKIRQSDNQKSDNLKIRQSDNLKTLFLDSAIMAAAYLAAFLMRFDFREPPWGWGATAASFITVWLVETSVLWLSGCGARWRFKARDIPRFTFAYALSGAILLVLRAVLPDAAFLSVRPPYTVALLNTFFAAAGLTAERYARGLYAASRIAPADLLHRPAALADTQDVVALFAGKTVLVTGAGGSIGSEIVRQTAILGARRVVMLERGENALYEIDRKMRRLATSCECIPELADICDLERMDEVFAKYRPEIVLHAAAYKHVPMSELHPVEALRNNTLATRYLGESAAKHGVESFIMISTDKAVHPVSAMGKTKRLAEILLMDLNGSSPTRFSCVRFGNVLGSSGSVVPLFEEQIASGGPVTITHPDMRRYFMTVQEAVRLVLKAAAQEKTAIFTLDMGQSVKIIDLAEDMIRRRGLVPGRDIKIVFTGIRPGEKLFEELDVSEKSAFKTGHARIFTCREEPPPPQTVSKILSTVVSAVRTRTWPGEI